MGNVKIDPERVREVLTARGYTQKSFCESCEGLVPQTRENMSGNLSPNYFNKRLNKLESFESDMLDFICKQLDVIPEYLTGESHIALPYKFSSIESDIIGEDDLATAVIRRFTYGKCDTDSMKQKDLEAYKLLLWAVTGYFLQNKGYMKFYDSDYTDGILLDNIHDALSEKRQPHRLTDSEVKEHATEFAEKMSDSEFRGEALKSFRSLNNIFDSMPR